MSFSFNPGQTGQQNQPSGSEAPPLVVPTAPTISTVSTAPQEVLSPFAYKNRSKSKFGVYFQLAVFLIFVLTLGVTIALFAYREVLSSKLESKKTELSQAQADFPDLDLEEMIKFSNRLKIINKIMNEHASVNTAFAILEASIENPVTYTKFSLSKNKTKSGYNLNFAGQTTSYEALYQQTEALNSKRFSSVFSKLNISGLGPLDKKGVGTFKVDTTVTIEGLTPETIPVKPKSTTDVSSTPSTATEQVPAATPPAVGTTP